MFDANAIKQSIQQEIANAIDDAKANMEAYAREQVETAGRETTGRTSNFVDGAIEFGKAAADWAMKDEVWGEDIDVDNGKTPYRFGYGENKNTLFETGVVTHRSEDEAELPWEPTTTKEVAAKLRAFGHASARTLTASIGLEGEAGYTQTSKNGTPDGAQIFHDTETFFGLRGRGHGEIGVLGGSAGAEVFGGASIFNAGGEGRQDSESNFYRHTESAAIGAGTAGEIDADVLGFEAFGRVWAGVEGRMQRSHHFAMPDNAPSNIAFHTGFRTEQALEALPLGLEFDSLGTTWRDAVQENGGDALNPLGTTFDVTGKAFAGAVAEGTVETGFTSVEIGGEAFTGIKAGIRPEVGLAWAGEKVGSLFLDLEGRIGYGVSGKIDIGYSDGTIKAIAKGGVAAGVGFQLGAGGSISTKALGFDVVDTDD